MYRNLSKFINFLKEHSLIIIGSLLLTIIIFAPLVIFPYVAGSDYRGINVNHFGSDAIFYLTRGQEVLDGHGLGNPVLREGKNEPDIFFSYSDYILLAPIKLLGLAQKVNIVTVYNIYNFVGVFFLIILVYSLVLQLSRKKLLSVAAALFMIGGYSLVFNKTLFYDNFNFYARVIYPYFSSLILFIYLNLLIHSLKSTELKYKIFSGMAFGLLFYIYFYAWSFALALNASLFLVFLIKKDFLLAKKILVISLIGLALGSYNLIRLFLSLGSELGRQQSYFMWMSYGHDPIFSKIGFITLALFILYFFKRRDDENLPFIFAIILSGWVALNQQVITGRMLQYGHYYWYFIVPLSIIISFYMIWRLMKREDLKKILFIFLIAVVFLNTAVGQYKSFFTTLEQKKYEQTYRPIIDALNQDKNESVILSTEDNGYLLTTYTSHNLFWQSAASFNNVPIQRFKDVLFVYLYLNKESRNNFKDYLIKIFDSNNEDAFCQNLYRNLEGYWSGYSFSEYNIRIKDDNQGLSQSRPEIVEQLSKEYDEAVLKNNGVNNLLKKYGVNYIIWDKNENPTWDLSVVPGLKQIVVNHNIYLYSLAN